MTGCSAAIAAAQRYRDAETRCPAKKHPGKCRRVGGTKQCGECAGDLLPHDMPNPNKGRGQENPAARKTTPIMMPVKRLGASPDAVKAISATPSIRDRTDHSAVNADRIR